MSVDELAHSIVLRSQGIMKGRGESLHQNLASNYIMSGCLLPIILNNKDITRLMKNKKESTQRNKIRNKRL